MLLHIAFYILPSLEGECSLLRGHGNVASFKMPAPLLSGKLQKVAAFSSSSLFVWGV